MHANSLRHIDQYLKETGEPKDGVFPEIMPIIKNISASKVQKNKKTGHAERGLKVQTGGR